jgi:pimeloyl-ACP methyl ester carboxylesterase
MQTTFTIEQEYCETPYRRQELSFPASRFQIAGDLILPVEGENYPLIVFVWGSGPAGRHLIGKPSQLLSRFMASRYAIFIADKPGTGSSTGEFSSEHLLSERATILTAELEALRNHPEINAQQVGVYGSSQAAYVIAMAIGQGANIDFVLAVSCPAQDSVEQSAYLVAQQLLCEDCPKDEAEMAQRCYIQRDRAQSYAEYLEAAQFLETNPVVRDDLDWGGVITENEFEPRPPDWDEFFDPAVTFHRLTMPVLAIFGEKDTQINPVQGAIAYQQALTENGNPLFRVVTVPNADHNMRQAKTGCLKEQRESYNKPGGASYHPVFLDVLGGWLSAMKNHWRES